MATAPMGVRKYVDSKRPLSKIVAFFDEMEDLGYRYVIVDATDMMISDIKLDMTQWCNNQFGHKNWISFGNRYWFTDDAKAMAFRLRWC